MITAKHIKFKGSLMYNCQSQKHLKIEPNQNSISLKKIQDTKKSATWTDTKKMERVTGIEPAL